MITALAAAVVYFVAHAVRAARFWLALGERQVSFLRVFMIFYGTAVLAFALPVAVSEPVRIALLVHATGMPARVLLTYVLCRSADGVVVLLFTAAVHEAGASGQRVLPTSYWAIGAFSMFWIAFVLVSASLTNPLQQYLLTKWHNRVGVLLMRVVSGFTRAATVASDRTAVFVAAVVLLSVVVWSLDSLAYWGLNMARLDWAQSTARWLAGSVHSLWSAGPLRHLADGGSDPEVSAQRVMMGSQTVFFAVAAVGSLLRSRFGSTAERD